MDVLTKRLCLQPDPAAIREFGRALRRGRTDDDEDDDGEGWPVPEVTADTPPPSVFPRLPGRRNLRWMDAPSRRDFLGYW